MVAKSENMYNTTGTNTGLDNQNGMAFTTTDRDQDERSDNCAARLGEGGGWWYKACSHVYLNGRLVTSEAPLNQHMRYTDFSSSDWIMLSSSEMRMIRVGWLEDKLRLEKMTIEEHELTTKKLIGTNFRHELF